MYWNGIKGELENIIRTLRIWQLSEFADVKIEDEADDNIHGFDTFLDQVCQEARAHALRYGKLYYIESLAICRVVKGEN